MLNDELIHGAREEDRGVLQKILDEQGYIIIGSCQLHTSFPTYEKTRFINEEITLVILEASIEETSKQQYHIYFKSENYDYNIGWPYYYKAIVE